jgi:hypothetical protein
MRRTILSVAGAVSLAAAAQAQGAADPAAELAAKQWQLDMLKLQVEQKKAEKELVGVQVEALGLKGAEGKTTLGADAGKLEGAMLASRAVEEAAVIIADRVKSYAQPIALLRADEQIDVSAGLALPREMTALTAAGSALVSDMKCKATVTTTAALAPVAPLVGAALSLLKTDTEISGFQLEAVDRALVDAIAGKERTSGKWVFLGEVNAASANNEVVKAFDSLLAERETVRTCLAQIEGSAMSDAEKKAAAPKIAVLDAMAKRFDAFTARVSAPRESGPDELSAAISAAAISAVHKDLLGLRVSVGEAGGSILKRSNLFTALGAPAVGITGGIVVSWRLFDPADGSVKEGGILVCRTALTNLNAIHKGTSRKPSCDWTAPATKGRAGP